MAFGNAATNRVQLCRSTAAFRAFPNMLRKVEEVCRFRKSVLDEGRSKDCGQDICFYRDFPLGFWPSNPASLYPEDIQSECIHIGL
jgi:hypothetical protein